MPTPKNPCRTGKPFGDPRITVTPEDNLELRFRVCKSPAALQVRLGAKTVAAVDPVGNETTVLISLAAANPGEHSLLWAYVPTAKEWQTESELFLNGEVVARYHDAPIGSFPLGFGQIYLEVS